MSSSTSTTMSSTTTKPYDPTNLPLVYSWVHDLRRCVTTRSAALELGITRREAAALLRDLIGYDAKDDVEKGGKEGKGGKGVTYEVNVSRVVRNEDGGDCKTAVELVKETVAAGDTLADNGTVYSIALLSDGAPTVQSAHERTKALLRDMVLSDEQDEGAALDPDMHCDDVKPSDVIAPLIKRSDYNAMRLRRIAATLPKGVEPDLHGAGGGASSSSASMARKKKAAPARKATSAASFFGSGAGASSSTAKKSSSSGSSKPKPKPTNKLGFSAKPNDPAEDGKENTENTVAAAAAASKPKKKPAVTKSKKSLSSSSPSSSPEAKSSNKARGTADDFVGDEDEDEDFLESEAQRKKRIKKEKKAAERKLEEQKKKQAPAARSKAIQDDGGDDDMMDVDKEEDAVYGEMDFHFNANKDEEDGAAKKAAGGGKKKRQRKKLVEKTTQDARGFLVTETVVEWEDIPSDEEEEAKASPAKKLKSAPIKKVKNTKGMKQAGLGAFFGAPKKK